MKTKKSRVKRENMQYQLGIEIKNEKLPKYANDEAIVQTTQLCPGAPLDYDLEDQNSTIIKILNDKPN